MLQAAPSAESTIADGRSSAGTVTGAEADLIPREHDTGSKYSTREKLPVEKPNGESNQSPYQDVDAGKIMIKLLHKLACTIKF